MHTLECTDLDGFRGVQNLKEVVGRISTDSDLHMKIKVGAILLYIRP
jgi:hypothetical protein